MALKMTIPPVQRQPSYIYKKTDRIRPSTQEPQKRSRQEGARCRLDMKVQRLEVNGDKAGSSSK